MQLNDEVGGGQGSLGACRRCVYDVAVAAAAAAAKYGSQFVARTHTLCLWGIGTNNTSASW